MTNNDVQASLHIASNQVTPMGAESKSSGRRSWVVDLLVILFGVSSWVAVNGLWVELPVLVDNLPEKWQLASYIVVTTQLANLGPLLFSAIRRVWSQKVLEVPIIHASLAIAVIGCVLLSIFWDYTTYTFGGEHSTAFLVLTFLLACVDCTSSLLFLPFIANFKEQYVISYMIGSGLSGPLPGFLAMGQGVGGGFSECRNVTTPDAHAAVYKMKEYHPPPRFSTSLFFAILCGQMVVSWIAFGLLNYLNVAKKERVTLMPISRPSVPALPENSVKRDLSSSCENAPLLQNLPQRPSLSVRDYYCILAIQGFLSTIMNGVLLSVQTYSCLPYGSKAFHFTTTLSSIANPLCCFFAMFLPRTSVYGVSASAAFVSGWSAYILSAALLSPEPPFVGSPTGPVLIVLAWIMASGGAAYTKACIASILRKEGGQVALYHNGVVTQIGAAIGAITTFLLIKYTTLFKSYSPCS